MCHEGVNSLQKRKLDHGRESAEHFEAALTFMSAGLHASGEHQACGSGEAHAANVGEAGVAQPFRVFGFTVAAAAARPHQHVEGEESGETRRGLIGFENEILHNEAAAASEGPIGALEKSAIFFGGKHVTDGGDEDEIEIFAKRIAQHVANTSGDAIGKTGLANVLLCERHDIGEIHDFGFEIG